MTRGALLVGLVHPLHCPDGPWLPLPADAGRRMALPPMEDGVVTSPRIRYVPDAALVFLHAVDRLQRAVKAHGWSASSDRTALILDSGDAVLPVQAEYYAPVRTDGEDAASALLFPHTSDASIASLAAVNFGIRGPCFVMNATPPVLVETAADLLTTGLQAVILGALQVGVKTGARDPGPAVDCAAACWIDADRLDAARVCAGRPRATDPRYGQTGPCAWMIEEVFRG